MLKRSVVVPVRVPFVAIVLVVTSLAFRIAYPMTATSIIVGLVIFRLTPAYVTILVACHTYTVVAIHIAAFVGARDGGCWIDDPGSQEYDGSKKHGFESY